MHKLPGIHRLPSLGLKGHAPSKGGGVTYRIQNVTTTEGYVVWPHPQFGAIAAKLVIGNNGSSSTPAGSIGSPFGGIRLAGFRRLKSVDADPTATSNNLEVEILSDDIGSQQYALQIDDAENGNLYGGIYHGGIQFDTEDTPSIATSREVDAFFIRNTFTITWPDGKVATGTEEIRFNANGSVTSTTTITSSEAFLLAYLDMTIGDRPFRYATPEGGGQVNIYAPTNYDMGSVDAVTMLSPASGTTITVRDNVRGLSIFKEKHITRNASRSKLYATLDTDGEPLGTITVTRQITFEATAPAVFSYDPATEGLEPVFIRTGTPSIVGSALRFTRSATVIQKAEWYIYGLTSGATYRIPISVALAGGGATSGSNGMAFVVTTSKIGSIIDPAPLANINYASVIAAGHIQFTVPDGITAVTLLIQQSTGTAGQLVDVSSLGPIALQ